jgi:hypothetical protein
MLVFARRVAFAFGVDGGKIVDSRYIDRRLGLRRVSTVFGKSRHKLPEFMAAITITINCMVMAVPVGETFSTVSIKICLISL